MGRWREAAPPSRSTMSEAALRERRRKCLQERRKARTSQMKAVRTTLKALGRCRGGGEVFPRRAGRGTRAGPGRRSPALSTPRRTRRVRPQAQGAQAGAVRWWWKGKRNEGRGEKQSKGPPSPDDPEAAFP